MQKKHIAKGKRTSGTSVVRGGKTDVGDEIWIVRSKDGRFRKHVTSKKSVASMERTAKRFSGALKRLADR